MLKLETSVGTICGRKKKSPRQIMLPMGADAAMDTGPERFEIGTPGKASAQDEDELAE